MKWRLSYIVLILVALLVGYLIDPLFFPGGDRVVRQEQPEEERVAEIDIRPKEEEPKPEPIVDNTPTEPEEPEPVIEDSQEDDEEKDQESADITKMRIAKGEDDGHRPVQEEKIKSPIRDTDWRRPKLLERKLATRIRTGLGGKMDMEHVLAYIRKPENRIMIAQWELLHRADMDALSDLLRDMEVADSLSKLLNDLPWVSSFVYDGEMCKPEIALAMINQFRKADKDMDKDILFDNVKVKPGVKRRIAAAVAVEFTRNNWYGNGVPLTKEQISYYKDTGIPLPDIDSDSGKKKGPVKDNFRQARERYLFFAQSWDQGLLNSSFGNLPDWLLHFPCGWKGDSPFGTASTMRWLRDNTSATARDYMGMCSQVPYLPLNKYGDVIFSKYYYQPFDVHYPGNFAKETRDIGAVCGGLSHFGASSACANGIPAFTMGEPGHCAYAVYFDGEWHPTNSISEKRQPHYLVWGLNRWSALQMMTEMYHDGQRTRDAQMMCSLAALLSQNKNPVNALKLYEMAVTMQPLYNPVWTMYMETAAKHLSRRPSKYLGVNDFVCTSVAPKHPEMCARYLTETIYPTLLKTLKTSRQKMVAFKSYFENLNENEKAEWDMETMLNMQYDSLGDGRPAKLEFFQLISDSIRRRPSFGAALSWAVRRGYMEQKTVGERVRKMVDTLLEELPKDAPDYETTRVLLKASVIRAAEEMTALSLASQRGNGSDREFYLKLANEYSKEFLKPDENNMPEFTPPRGRLVSPGGVVMLCKFKDDKCTSEYDPKQESIVTHAAALTPQGGAIISEKGKHQQVVVELPKRTNIGGVVIVPSGSDCKSYREWFVETSRDGKTWDLLTNLPDESEKPCVVVNVERGCPSARYIRIDSGAEQNQGINFKAILVYDNKK